MKQLTPAEEQVMQVLWNRGPSFVKEILAELPEPKPAYTTVSTIVRILQQKEMVGHEAFGKSHRYHTLISKEEYSGQQMDKVLNSYFSGSVENMLSFFVKKKNMDVNELDDILKELKKDNNDDA